MAKNTGGNTANENTEQANTQKPKKADESMMTRAIRGFVEHKLSLSGGVFNQMMASKCTGLEAEFMTFVEQNREFDGQSKDQLEAFRAVTSAQFLRETIALGAAFASKRKALEHVTARGYSFTNTEMKKVQGEHEKLSRDELTTLVQSESKREKFLKNLFPGKTLPYKSEKDQINTVFGKNNLSTMQEEKVMNLLVKRYVDPQEVQEALPLFDDTQKQLLLKTFLPTVTLGQLRDMGALTKAQVLSAVHESIEKGGLIPEFDSLLDAEKKGAIDQIDPYDIVIETMLFPKEIVDTILLGQGSKMIAEELSRINTARYDEVDAENALKMKATPEGLFFPPFLQKLDKLGIRNVADLKTGSIIQGTIPGMNGKDIAFAYRIDDIKDDPEENKTTGGNGRVFAMSDILLPSGLLHLGKKKSLSAEYNYAELYHIFDKTRSNIEILTPEATQHRIQAGTLKETLVEEDIKSLGDLNRALNAIDPVGSSYSLKAEGGASIEIGKVGDKNYCVHQVKSINEVEGTIEITNGQNSEIFDYVTFYSIFESREAKRLPPMKTASDFLEAMKLHSPKKDAYSKLSMEGDKIVPEDRKGEEKYAGITEFAGSKGYVKILDTKTPGKVEFLVYEDFDETKGLDKQNPKPKKYSGEYNLLYTFLNTEVFEPNNVPKETEVPDKVDPHIHYHKGGWHHYMGNPSLHDIFHGSKGFVDAIKKKLEHGSHLHAANVQLGIAKGMKSLGLINEGILREMRSGVHTGNKKLMQEMVDELKNMSGPERQEEVMHILSTKGSHDYEIQAATMAMLQKHGALYVGKLRIWEGSFLYFERLSGQKFSENLDVVKSYRKRCGDTGEPFTEEGLIVSYIKTAGDNNELDSTLWTDIAKAWGQGRGEEGKKGEELVGQYQMSKGRIKHVMDRFESGETAHALGGFDAIWAKGGSAHEMHLPAIILALSNIPRTLHQEQLNTLKNKFYGGHPYTALLFLGSSGNQNIFRSVMKQLAASNGLAKEYAKIEALQKKDPDKELIKTIMKFWTDHGASLNNKLNVTADGELLHLAKTDSDCATYLKTCEENVGGIGKLDDDERDNGVYEHGGSSFLGLNPDHYFKFIRMNAGQVAFESDDNTTRFWPSFNKSLGAIKDMKAGTSEETEEMQKELYMKYHKALMSYFNAGRIEKSAYEDKLGKQDYIQELKRNYGVQLTPYGKSFLETPSYIQAVEEDFEFFRKGGRPDSITTETENVAGSVGSLLENTGYKGATASNDGKIRQTA